MSVVMTARDVKDCLYNRHPTFGMGDGPGEWTCLEEPFGIDFLAMSAWSSSNYDRIGYEVKVSRSDYRRELLKPSKRLDAQALCHEFWMAVPAGLLKPEEKAWEESLWDDGDFERELCPDGCKKARWGGRSGNRAYMPTVGTVTAAPMPVPVVLKVDNWYHDEAYRLARLPEDTRQALTYQGWTHPTCPTCGGKGFIRGSRVEREAPTLWIPRDVGLVEVDGTRCHVVRKAPRTEARALKRGEIASLVRWASYRPDRRHRPPVRTEMAA